jgi:type I restriction enzyme, S subunit
MNFAKLRPIKDYCLGIYDGPHATPKEAEDGPVFLGIKNLTDDGAMDFSEIRHVSEEEYPRWTRRVIPQPGDVVFTYEATLHRYALIPDGFRGCLGRRVALVRPNPARVDSRYLLYFFLSREWRQVVESSVITGATVDRIPLERFPDFPAALPELRLQHRIADVLSAYDDLIVVNRRRMALLEDAARQLYSEWFVRLRFPGHEHTRITNGIPEGWVRVSLGEVADFRLGKMLDQNKNKGDLMPYLANVNVRWGDIELHNLREMQFEENELDTFGVRYGDIVMCEGGEPGRCAIWKEQLPNMMIQKAIHRIRAGPNVSYLFLYWSLRHKAQSGQLAMLFTGATIKHLPREKLALVSFDMPPLRLMRHFVDQVDPLEKQIALLEAANRRASQARDLLLPRLMTGEIAA